MTSQGEVRAWYDEAGWGVIDSASTPGGCWGHFSAILATGFRALRAGQAVSFTFEVAEQDGYAYRVTEVWAADEGPVPGVVPSAETSDQEATGAYGSTLTLEFDDGLTDRPQEDDGLTDRPQETV